MRTILEGADAQPLSDPAHAPAEGGVDRGTVAGLVSDLIAMIDEAGLAGARFCVPLSSSIGSVAALMAVMETTCSGALIPLSPADEGPEPNPDWPGFCEAVLIPPDATQGAGSARIVMMPGGRKQRGEDRIYLRTSGTTGRPKWAAHDTDKLLENGRAVAERMELSPADRVMIPVPIHHMFGLGAGLLPSLVAGSRIHLVPRGNPLVFFQAQRGFDPTAIFMVPSQCRSVMALGRGSGSARAIVVAGDKLFPDEAVAFEAKHGTLVALYGATELGAITASSPRDPQALRHATAGPPLRGMTLDLADEEADPAAEGAVPFRVRAEYGLLGYVDWDSGDMIAEAPEVWPTGDLIRLHDGDRIEVLGRSDHAVNRDGLLVHMGQIEGCLTRAEGVDQAVVVTAGTSRRGAGLVAFCTLTKPGANTDEGILAHARAELQARAVPDRLIVVESLPMLASGKADRLALTAQAEALSS
ncbi:AMP-binding protein [Flavimaricola marinus]|uniref:AMP-binding protein n=1 Tax=Flavimaricola marinus TaxID=1819565 RepID=UPI001455292C|nr:long-chain fatty acid--CoA ligase [Flavimaricola marinus]